MRSKSMTSELEELDKVDEVTPSQRQTRDNVPVDMRVATIKPRPSSRCFATPAGTEMNSLYDRQGVAVVPPTVPGSGRAGYLGVPKGTMRRQKSIGITEEEKQFLTPPLLKFTRSLSMPDTSEDIPPPPAISPPSPPYNSPKSPTARGYGTMRPGFNQNSAAKGPASNRGDPNMGTIRRDKGAYYRQESEQYDAEEPYDQNASAQQNYRNRRAQVPENPYSEVGKQGNKALYVPAKPARRKGMLVKQPNVEDSPEKTCSIPIPTIIVKEPSTSSSGKSSQGSSMEIETTTPDQPGQLRPEDGLNVNNPFAAAIAGAVRDREKRLEARRNSPAFLSTDLGDEDVGPTPAPRLRHSKSIDEGMFGNDERLRKLMAPPSSLVVSQGGGNVTDFNTPEPTLVREPLNTRTGNSPNLESPVSLPAIKTYSSNGGNYVHPVTGKALDPNSPLALALAARDRAMKDQAQPAPPKNEPLKPDLNKPLFIDTKLRPNLEASFSVTATMGRPGRGALRRQMTESKYETNQTKEDLKPEEKKNMLIDIVDTSQQKSAGLLMVHTVDGAKAGDSRLNENEVPDTDSTPSELRDPNQPTTADPIEPPAPNPQSAGPRGKTIITISSVDEPVKLPFRIPPPPLASVDIEEEFVFSEPLPPPLEFANSIDIPEDHAGAIAELLKHRKNGAGGTSLSLNNPHALMVVAASTEPKKPAGLSNCVPPSFPPPPPDGPEPITDSGIEEVDSRSSGDPPLETTSTISTVSSISTLSSEGGETLDTCTVYADGQAFLVDRPPVPPKPKMKPIINKSNALYKDALIEESLETMGLPPPAPPPPPGGAQADLPKTPTQRTSKLWGDPPELKSPPTPDPKATVISELNSFLLQMNRDRPPKPGEALDSPTGSKTHFGPRGPEGTPPPSATQRNTMVTFAARPGAHPTSRQPESMPPQQCGASPISSPPDSGTGRASSLPASSPTLTDAFGFPTPPPAGERFGLASGRSRSPSPLTLVQAVSNKPFASKPVLLWTKHDVADWLESLNLAEHKDAFLDNEIEGAHLPNLQKEDLIDLGVTRVGHRMNIERALKILLDR
ncbi:hypothetical protein SKAU_G00351770 [Synaphobranchus kaupii]|uniref:SAM domain-containing protein n=1 Tax=Synaphobranchus kaupii TaxID=118154 RepID=A0A9Q1II99_SYNKA|nr:hypothetical protein SKAU_G00351770 [Synaphobranchus kaupii]